VGSDPIWDIYPLISFGKGDRVLRLVQVLGVVDGVIIGGDRHDLQGGELLLPVGLDDYPPAKD